MDQKQQKDAGRTIGKYRILAKLGEGSMGAVFKGQDPSTGATVAIKLASIALSRDTVLLQRFEQEFRSTRNLDHPNLVRGLEFGWKDSRPFIVMELVDGEDMWVRITRLGRLTEADAVNFITQAAQGLHEAHKNGIIHRDIKPDNILLTTDGRAKLTDLGLSKDLEGELELTRPDKGIGTPNFIAPEQFSDAKHAGVRCDIYSLGATLYMALTGKLPFAAHSLSAILKQKVADELLAPSQLVPDLSHHVEAAVRRAVLADPEQRFASCPEFIAALSGKTEGSGVAEIAERRRPARRSGSSSRKLGRERRAALRYGCTLPTSCTINLSLHPDETESQASWEAQVCDLSVGGIGLILSRRFEPGSVLTVQLANSDGDTKRTRAIRVVRVSSTGGRGWFLGGTLIEKLSKEELRLLLKTGAAQACGE